MGIPNFDGRSFSWKAFLKEWKVYWGFQRDMLGPKQKPWIFIRCLPDRWRQHMKAQITDSDWTFREILEFLNKQCNILVPDWKKLQAWRNCLPQGSTYLEFTHWWLT